jgi:hypothetical protein
MTESLQEECLDSITHAGSCCEGMRRPFSQRKESIQCKTLPASQGIEGEYMVTPDIEEAIEGIGMQPSEIQGVIQERGDVYGPANVNLDCIAQHWRVYRINQGVRKESMLDVCYQNILQKISRLARTPNHRDSLIDIIGYAEIALEHIGEGEK